MCIILPTSPPTPLAINTYYTLIHHCNRHSKCPCLPPGHTSSIPLFSVVPPTHRVMCLQSCCSPPAHHFNAAAPPPVNAGVRKQCRLLGKSAHKAFVKVRQHALAPPRVLPPPQPPARPVPRHRRSTPSSHGYSGAGTAAAKRKRWRNSYAISGVAAFEAPSPSPCTRCWRPVNPWRSASAPHSIGLPPAAHPTT